MSKINDGGPAFPLGSTPEEWMNGMSLRDYFAAKAIQSLICVSPSGTVLGRNHRDENLNHARCAYAIADAMLIAREEGPIE